MPSRSPITSAPPTECPDGPLSAAPRPDCSYLEWASRTRTLSMIGMVPASDSASARPSAFAAFMLVKSLFG
jgi:hypothetical protein